MCAGLRHYEEQTWGKQGEKSLLILASKNLFILIFLHPQVRPATQLPNGYTSQILRLAHKVLIILLAFYLPVLLRNISL